MFDECAPSRISWLAFRASCQSRRAWLILEGDLLSVAERGDIQCQGAPVLYTGTIKTLAIDAKARLVPSDPASTSDKAPDLRVIVSGVEIGAAWRRISKDDRIYHSVKLDDPSFTAPIYANLFEGDDGSEFALIWSR